MDGLPPPTPPEPPRPSIFRRKYRGAEGWVWALVLVVAIGVVAYVVSPETEDEPDRPSRQELADSLWGDMSLTDRAAICDGYRLGGESFTVDNLLEGTSGDEDAAELLLGIVKRECD